MDFNKCVSELKELIEDIRSAAHKAHADVNQFYGSDKPYSYHLDSVVEYVIKLLLSGKKLSSIKN